LGELSPRERQVVLLAANHTSAQIASRLSIPVPTVNNNLARAYTKLGISGREQLRMLIGDSLKSHGAGPVRT
jgi:DNA-binding CsgD family transcriptional regulator